MDKFLTHETQGKVISLLGAALVSLMFLFAVTVSNAGFQGVQNPLPNPFASAKVVAVLDNVSNSYSKFLYANLINPLGQQYAFVADNVSFVADNAGPQIIQMAGLQNLAESQTAYAMKPQVAGASTQVVYSQYYPSSSGGVFSLFVGH